MNGVIVKVFLISWYCGTCNQTCRLPEGADQDGDNRISQVEFAQLLARHVRGRHDLYKVVSPEKMAMSPLKVLGSTTDLHIFGNRLTRDGKCECYEVTYLFALWETYSYSRLFNLYNLNWSRGLPFNT